MFSSEKTFFIGSRGVVPKKVNVYGVYGIGLGRVAVLFFSWWLVWVGGYTITAFKRLLCTHYIN